MFRTRLPLLAAALPALALAGDGPYLTGPVDAALETPGLVVFELTKPGTCEDDGFDDPETGAWLLRFNAHAMVLDRKKRIDDVERLVAGGREVLPMRVAVIDGQEVDRTCGCQTSEQLTTWMTGLLTGKTLAQQTRAKLGDPAEGFEINAELEVVRMHWCANRHLDAFDTLMQLWQLIPEQQPALRELRLTRVAHDMGVLARKSEEVTERLRALRDGLGLAKDDTYEAAADWVALNRILLDDDRTLAWYHEARQDPERAHLARNQAPNVYFVYLERKQWADAGQVIDDPEVWLDRWKKVPGGVEQAAEGYAALLAAGRKGDAGKLAKAILKVEAGASCQLLSKSVEAGAMDKSQKGLTKGCDNEAIVAAWEAALP